jgi:hypothetical protein
VRAVLVAEGGSGNLSPTGLWALPLALKKLALELFPYESTGLGKLGALAHNFVHKKCGEAGASVGRVHRCSAATFLGGKISPSKINNLP